MCCMAKGKNDGFLGRQWVREQARKRGWELGGTYIVTPDGRAFTDEAFRRADWESLVARFPQTITREIDPEHLTQEEQADLVASQMTLRGSKTQLRGALTKLEGLMMRPNAMLQPDRIDAALKEVEDLAKSARAEVAKFRKAS